MAKIMCQAAGAAILAEPMPNFPAQEKSYGKSLLYFK
jgi:hypothetical protein